MDLASAATSLHVSCFSSLRKANCSGSSDCSPPFSFLRSSIPSCSITARVKGNSFVVNHGRLQQTSMKAIAGRTAANDFTRDQVKLFDSSAHGVAQEPLVDSADKEDEKGSHENLGGQKMLRVCDKLIEVFLVDKPTPTDWRRLLTVSKEWNNIRPHFFKRCQERANGEDNADMKPKLLKLGRKLKEIDEDVQRHNELLDVIKRVPSEINEVVARRRKDFTKEFFVHLHTVAASYYNNAAEQTALAELGNMCVAAVQAYDSTSESIEALNAAELKFQDIINSPSLDAACKKIDSLAEKNQLDSALVLMITKAWSTAKETNMTKDEVKDVLYHLYVTARDNLRRLMPNEIRILKHILMIEDPEEVQCTLKDAFTPGEVLEGNDVDCLYTTPEKLHTWMKIVVDAYHSCREGTLIREARDLMNPKVIQKIEELIKVVEKSFM